MLPLFSQQRSDSLNTSYYKTFVSPQDSITKYRKLSMEAYGLGDWEKVKDYSEIVLDIAIVHQLKEIEIRSLVNLAIYYQQTDQYELSLAKYLEAEDMTKLLPEDSYLRVLVKVNLGNLYNAIGDYGKVDTLMQKVLDLAKKQENHEQIELTTYNILGTSLLYQKRYEEAIRYFEKVKEMSIALQYKDATIRAMINISDCYVEMERYQDVLANSSKALLIFTEKESIETKALLLVTIVKAHMGLNEFDKALEPAKEVKEIAIAGNFLKIGMDTHQLLAQIYESRGDLEKSLEEQKNYTESREAYLSTLSKAQRLKVEKELESKTNVVEEQKESLSSLNTQKKIYISLGILFAVLLVVSTILFRRRKKILAFEASLLQEDKELLKNENETLKDTLNALARKIKDNTGNFDENETSESYKNSSLSEEERETYMQNILTYMDNEKPYLNPEIKQSDIANDLSMSVHTFSEVLNASFDKNFNHFINLYRVNEARKLMKSPKYNHYKVLAIGYEAGFPSKTSFNRIFKNLVGLTPSEYRKKNIPQSDLINN